MTTDFAAVFFHNGGKMDKIAVLIPCYNVQNILLIVSVPVKKEEYHEGLQRIIDELCLE